LESNVSRETNMKMNMRFDLVVVGGGHAGIEASVAANKMGIKTALITMDKNAIGRMSCNPAIGGLAKGHLVREIDALGGIMGSFADLSGIQFKMLNRSKGKAVWSPRAQIDKKVYEKNISAYVRSQKNIQIIESEAKKILKELKKQNQIDDIIKNAENSIQGEAAKRTVQREIGEESLLKKLLEKEGLSENLLKPGFNPKTKKFIKKENMTFKGEGTSTNKRIPPDLNNSDGGEMTGPETGYLAVLHGRERIIPEENQYTRSKGVSQRVKTNTIMMVENNRGGGSGVMMQPPKGQVVPIFLDPNPFDVATKYSELIAKVTV